jgi:anaphase-promoting complex subunit 2
LTVSPIHASIIYQFQVKAQWTAEELAHILKISVSTLRRRMVFWQSQGLVKETAADVFTLIEEGPMRRMSGAIGPAESGHDLDEESESVTRTSRDQRAEELQVFWSFIVNMLINLESLPLDRIFQMLKMFAMQGPSAVECDIEELRSFLDDKVRQHELLFSGGQYKLPKT